MIGACLVWSWIGFSLSGGEAPPELQSRVKAVYLFNFLNFVEYPETNAPSARGRTICLLGEDPVGAVLDDIAKTRTIAGLPVRIRRINAATQAQGCHVLFVAVENRRRLRAAMEQLQNSPILTVSECAEFLDVGGVVLLYTDAGRLRFEINPGSAMRAGLQISSKLMVLSHSAR